MRERIGMFELGRSLQNRHFGAGRTSLISVPSSPDLGCYCIVSLRNAISFACCLRPADNHIQVYRFKKPRWAGLHCIPGCWSFHEEMKDERGL
jgi:hypothetical protein